MTAVKPVFTEAQADAVRLALSSQLMFYGENRIDERATANALRQLDVAHRETLRRKRQAAT